MFKIKEKCLYIIFFTIIVYFTIGSVNLVESAIPSACVHNVTRHHVCCPVSKGSMYRCGGPHRGECAPINVFRDKVPAIFAFDDRVHWPTKFFQYLCRCKGRFFGVACEECWYGWEGPNCDRKVVRKRYNWLHLSPRKKKQFLKVMQLSFMAPSGYMIMIEQENWRSDPIKHPIFTPAPIHYFMVVLHRFASRTTLYDTKAMCDKYGVLDFNHDGPGFPTWHRYFMMFWERALQRIAKQHFGIHDFTIPYWNWVDSRECEICKNDMAGAPGPIDYYGQRLHPHSVFANWTEYCSEPEGEPVCYGCHYSGHFGKITRHWNNHIMPSTGDLDYAMSQHQYYVNREKDGERCHSFHMAIEGFCGPPNSDDGKLYMHNFVHNSIDGTMCCSAPATTDILFLVHHTEVDRQVEAWRRDHKPDISVLPNTGIRPGHCRECMLTAFLPPVKHTDVFNDIRNLGYDYDSFQFGKHGRVYGTGLGGPRHIKDHPEHHFKDGEENNRHMGGGGGGFPHTVNFQVDEIGSSPNKKK